MESMSVYIAVVDWGGRSEGEVVIVASSLEKASGLLYEYVTNDSLPTNHGRAVSIRHAYDVDTMEPTHD